eukprot:86429-Karenia_brevis.AAC.1
MKHDVPVGSRRGMSGAHAPEANVAHEVVVDAPNDEPFYLDHQNDDEQSFCERSDGSNVQA